jgi:hypothetical protein
MDIKRQFTTAAYDISYRGPDFGRIYVENNTTSPGFLVIQAVVEPLGVVVACTAVRM